MTEKEKKNHNRHAATQGVGFSSENQGKSVLPRDMDGFIFRANVFLMEYAEVKVSNWPSWDVLLQQKSRYVAKGKAQSVGIDCPPPNLVDDLFAAEIENCFHNNHKTLLTNIANATTDSTNEFTPLSNDIAVSVHEHISLHIARSGQYVKEVKSEINSLQTVPKIVNWAESFADDFGNKKTLFLSELNALTTNYSNSPSNTANAARISIDKYLTAWRIYHKFLVLNKSAAETPCFSLVLVGDDRCPYMCSNSEFFISNFSPLDGLTWVHCDHGFRQFAWKSCLSFANDSTTRLMFPTLQSKFDAVTVLMKSHFNGGSIFEKFKAGPISKDIFIVYTTPEYSPLSRCLGVWLSVSRAYQSMSLLADVGEIFGPDVDALEHAFEALKQAYLFKEARKQGTGYSAHD